MPWSTRPIWRPAARACRSIASRPTAFACASAPSWHPTPRRRRCWPPSTATWPACPPCSAETVDRLKKRFADARASEDRDAGQVYGRLVGWLAARNPYDEFARWPQRVAKASPEDVNGIVAALAGPGKVVTGILGPAGASDGK